MISSACIRSRLGVLLGLLPISLFAADPLPEPLTLAAALATAENPAHFELLSIDQRQQALRAELGVELGDNGFSLDLKGRIREVGPSASADSDDSEDSAASLVLSKPLYDFGLQSSRERYLSLQFEALEQQKRLLVVQRRLKILQRYFAVLNADNQFISENEALAIGFIRYDNALQDQELGLVAEIEVLRLQSAYEEIRQQRQQAQHQQRLTRALLAEVMGYPEHLPADLEIPRIDTGRSIPQEVGPLVQRAFEFSPEALLGTASTLAAQSAIAIAEASDNPSLDLELEVSSYQRDSRLRDDWRASLYFEIPLYSSAAPARVDLALAKHRQALASQQQLKSHLRLEVLELWQRLLQLGLEIQGKTIEQNYRDLYLDRSRAEYELEFKTDLGDSMVLYSRSNTARLQSLYAYELAYQRLAALVGVDYLNQPSASQ